MLGNAGQKSNREKRSSGEGEVGKGNVDGEWALRAAIEIH